MSKVPFTKPPLSLADQVALLKQRGMQIPDQELAEDTLLRLNYYRFSGYALHFEVFQDRQRTHQFKAGTSFDAVMSLYEFDTQLRPLLTRQRPSLPCPPRRREGRSSASWDSPIG